MTKDLDMLQCELDHSRENILNLEIDLLVSKKEINSLNIINEGLISLVKGLKDDH